MNRALVIAACVFSLFLAIAFYTPLKDFLYVHTWLLSTLAAAPGLIIPALELRHSHEANKLREEANRQRENANILLEEANKHEREANKYREEANVQRARANEALGQIAVSVKTPLSKAERNAEKLRKNLRTKAQVVNADDSSWGSPAEIVEVKDEVVTLFTPAGFSSSSAFAVYVHCDNLEIFERTGGALALKILRRAGDQQLGQIRSWEEREQPAAAPLVSKGPNVFYADYTKPASSERRRLDIFESADGQNAYMLVRSTGEVVYGDNVHISRHFCLIQLELEVQGFRLNGSGSGNGKYPLYLKTRT